MGEWSIRRDEEGRHLEWIPQGAGDKRTRGAARILKEREALERKREKEGLIVDDK